MLPDPDAERTPGELAISGRMFRAARLARAKFNARPSDESPEDASVFRHADQRDSRAAEREWKS